MTGSYNAILVIASYCVAVIASYTAIYFGTRVFHFDGAQRRNWLVAGALCLGTGIWSMHFVGMSAFEMPMEMTMSFNAGLTVLSWLPALVASGLALHVITLPRVSAAAIAAASLIMGAGIFSMHYLGMYAMQMQPAIQYDPVWVSISAAIAVGASGAALMICRKIRDVPVQYAVWVKALAALVMGAAICGMHYSGMVAAIYPMDGAMDQGNHLQGSWMGVPTAIVVSGLLLLAIYVAYSDLRARDRARQAQERAQDQARQAAFYDAATGLPNRSHLERQLLERLTVTARGAQPEPFLLFYVELQNPDDAQVLEVAQQLKRSFSRAEQVVRYSSDSFMVLHQPLSGEEVKRKLVTLNTAFLSNASIGRWGWGVSQYPASASNSRGLMQGAQRVREWLTPEDAAPGGRQVA
ncbi:MHYT domain-containing protein [Marinimicrobium koreense]|uniref:MHYT domain-containing protein n=1 Tax=Marinimicrobium koreense TaxID=306545 RepID=UPI003F705262